MRRIRPATFPRHQSYENWDRQLIEKWGADAVQALIRAVGRSDVQKMIQNYPSKLDRVPPYELYEMCGAFSKNVIMDWLECCFREIPNTEEFTWVDEPLLSSLALGIHSHQIEAAERFFSEIRFAPSDVKQGYVDVVHSFFNHFSTDVAYQLTGRNITIHGSNFIYQGNSICGIPYGRGTLVGPNGKYTGDIVDGFCHGDGTFWHVSGVIDNGDFQNGSLNGQGIRILPDQTKIEGAFEEGIIRQGVIFYADHSVFKGPIRHDRAHGLGILKQNNGYQVKAIFRDREIIKMLEDILPDGTHRRMLDDGGSIYTYPGGLELHSNNRGACLKIGSDRLEFESDAIFNGLMFNNKNAKAILEHHFLDYFSDFKLLLGGAFDVCLNRFIADAIENEQVHQLVRYWTEICLPSQIKPEDLPSKEIRRKLFAQSLETPIQGSLAACLLALDPSLIDELPDNRLLKSSLTKSLVATHLFGNDTLSSSMPKIWLQLPALIENDGIISLQSREKIDFILTRMAEKGSPKIFGMLKDMAESQPEPQKSELCINLIRDLEKCHGYCAARAEDEVAQYYNHIFKNQLSGSSEGRLNDAFKRFLDFEGGRLARYLMKNSERPPGNEIHVGNTIRNLIATMFPSLEPYHLEDPLEESLSRNELNAALIHLSKVIKPISFMLFLEANLPDGKVESPIITQQTLNDLLSKIDPEKEISDYYDMDGDVPTLERNALMQILQNEGYLSSRDDLYI